MKSLSFVIPCYGSEQIVETVINDIEKKVLEKEEYSLEIIAVNDCSPDHVMDVLRQRAVKDKTLKVINLAGNVGKHRAILAGYKKAKGDYIVICDDDGQCPIERLWDLLDPLVQGHDMAIAKYSKKKESFLKRIGSKANSLTSQKLIGKPKDIVFSNFIARQKYICDAMIRYSNVFPYLEGLSLHITKDVVMVPMEEHERLAGHSHFSFKKSFNLWLDGFTAFSVKPLRVSFVIGGITGVLGAIIGIAFVIRNWILSIDTPASIGISGLILFMFGVLFLILGLMGEYVGRAYITASNYPQYVIKETINF